MQQTGFEFMNNNEDTKPGFGVNKKPDNSDLHPIYADADKRSGRRSQKSGPKVGSVKQEANIPDDIVPAYIPPNKRFEGTYNPSSDDR